MLLGTIRILRCPGRPAHDASFDKALEFATRSRTSAAPCRVQRNGPVESPRVAGSTSLSSNAATKLASCSARALWPAPGTSVSVHSPRVTAARSSMLSSVTLARISRIVIVLGLCPSGTSSITGSVYDAAVTERRAPGLPSGGAPGRTRVLQRARPGRRARWRPSPCALRPGGPGRGAVRGVADAGAVAAAGDGNIEAAAVDGGGEHMRDSTGACATSK